MRLSILLLVALLAGCLGSSRANGPGNNGPPDAVDTVPDPTMTASPAVAEPEPTVAPIPENGTQANSTQTASAPQPPPPIHDEGHFGPVVPFVPPYSECSHPLVECRSVWFRLDGAFDLEATLSWDLPANDLDLSLVRWDHDNGTEVSRDGDNAAAEPATSQVLRYDGLWPGYWYSLVIAPQGGARIEYTLDVVFS